MNKIITYIKDGKKIKVLLPEGENDPELGIPVSIDFSELYPDGFSAKLEEQLWKMGLVTIADYKKNGVLEKIRQAIQLVLKIDANDILNYVRTFEDD